MLILALFNVSAFTCLRLSDRGEQTWYRESMNMLALPYVFQTTWRCIFISEYPNRRTISDSHLNSVLVARLLAAIGEFCFGVQLVLGLQALTTAQQTPGPALLSIVVLDGLGQCCATYGTIAGSYFPFVMESIAWTIMFGIILALTLTSTVASREVTLLISAATAAAMLYMVVSYCPMCWRQWQEEERAMAKKEVSKPLRSKAWEALTLRVPTEDWSVWKHEVGWQSLYFSVGTWASLCLMSIPLQ